MFLSSQLDEYGWSNLSNSDKLVALNTANALFNKFQWIGYKVDDNQEDAFPRLIYKEVVTVPDDVVNALADYCIHWVRYNTDESIKDMRRGVKSVHIGNYSESYEFNSKLAGLSDYKKYLTGWLYRGNWREEGDIQYLI